MNNQPQIDSTQEEMVALGTWLGRHQAFGLIANRCSAADAECLRAIRDGGEYKKLGLTWDEFCQQRAGVSRQYAERLIRHLEEFGVNYFKLAELMHISGATYRLIAGSVSEEGIEIDGERIPIVPENRQKIMAAVQGARAKRRPAGDVPSEVVTARKWLDAFVGEVQALAERSEDRVGVIVLVEQGLARLNRLADALRRTTLVMR